MREKKIFCIYGCFSVSRYIEGCRNSDLNWIFRHTCVYKQPTWQSSETIIFLCKYYEVISDTLVSFWCALFVAFCNIIRAFWGTKKELRLSHKKKKGEYVQETSLFWLHAVPSMSFFVAFFVYSPFQVKYLLNGPNKHR